MTPLLFLAQRLSAAILAFAVAVHLATILYAVRGGLTAGEILGRTHGNLAFFCFYAVFVAAVAVHAPIGLRNVVREWTGFALPQAWLFGALLVLIYRVTAMLIPPRCWTDSELRHNRRAFVRLWCLAMALVVMQGVLFLLGNLSTTS